MLCLVECSEYIQEYIGMIYNIWLCDAKNLRQQI